MRAMLGAAAIAMLSLGIASAPQAQTASCRPGVQILCSQPGTGNWSVSVTDENNAPPSSCIGRGEGRCVMALGSASVQDCAEFSPTLPSVPGFSMVGAPHDGSVGAEQCSYIQITCVVIVKGVDPQGRETIAESRSCAGMQAQWNK